MRCKRGGSLKFTSWEVMKRFLMLFLPMVMLIGVITMAIYYSEVERDKEIIESKEMHNMDMLTKMIGDEFQVIVSDLMILSECNELQTFLEKPSDFYKESLAKEFLLFSEKRGIYDQIRFLNETGMEIVRINFGGGNPYIVPDDELQNKANRYYFKETFKLGRGEVYVSPFDLNIEHGEIEWPLKPVIRFGTPVFDDKHHKRGIVILNYLGDKLLEHFKWASSKSSLGEIMLLNPEGYWLKGIKKEDEWGFMLENRSNKTFGNVFPDAWQKIINKDSGQFYTEDGLFTFVTMYPLQEAMKSTSNSSFNSSKNWNESGSYFWKIVSIVPHNVLYEKPQRILKKVLQLDAVMFIILAISLWFVAYTNACRRHMEEELRRHRDHLQELVEEQTAELRRINEQLREEIAERKEAQEKLKKAYDEMKKVLEQEREFKLRTAHYFFNPITIAKGYLYLALEDEKHNKDKILKAIEAINRVEKVVKNITQRGEIVE